MKFEEKVVNETVEKLLKGEDYREEVVNTINSKFLDFSIQFFKDIVSAKVNNQSIDLSWYKDNFISNSNLKPEDIAINASINKKTITNIYGTATKEIVINIAEQNFNYLATMISELELYSEDRLDVKLTITYNDVSVNLTLTESLLVINALATRKLSINGGAWSSIGKRVEKPLMEKLCKLCGVSHYSKEHFVKDKTKDVDREIDFIIYNKNGDKLLCEVKLMGKGNPESADATIARDSNLFVADTLSQQNKNQLTQRNCQWVELRNHTEENILEQFKTALDNLNVEHTN